MSGNTQNSEGNGEFQYVKHIRGWAFPNSPMFRTENIIDTLDLMPQDDDIVLCSYPKTGSTWMQYIVWEIVHKGETLPSFDDATYRSIPFLEVAGVKALEGLEKPRIYKNHCPYHLMRINNKAKYIYVHRHPSDTLVSFYHFEKQMSQKDSPFDDYFERFMKGEVSYGDYFDHALSFFSQQNEPNLLLVSYEDLHRDKRGQILRLAKFIGDDYHCMLLEDDALLQKIIDVTSFDYMKKNLKLHFPNREGMPKKEVNFFRKGTVGDGKSLLSAAQAKRLQEKVLLKMEGTEFAEKWSNEP